MSCYNVDGTKNTPEINFDIPNNYFSIKGKSFPENAKKYFYPFANWVDENSLPKNAIITIHLVYLSSSSVIALLDILKRIEKQSNEIMVKWVFESGDDDLQNVGLNYQKLCGLTFEFVEVD